MGWREQFAERMRGMVFQPYLRPISREEFDAALGALDEPDEDGLLRALDVLGYDTTRIRFELAAEHAAAVERGRRYREEQRAKMTPRERQIDDAMCGAMSALQDKIADDLFMSNHVFAEMIKKEPTSG